MKDAIGSIVHQVAKKNLPRGIGREICGWVSKYRENKFPSQY
jgi:hypothetical protein